MYNYFGTFELNKLSTINYESMRIKLKNVATGKLVNAEIRKARQSELPSMQHGWRFNFRKHAKLKDAEAYVIVDQETPEIHGCLIFQMLEKVNPYMAFVEKAPHNKGIDAKFKLVAECLIAFACRQSFIKVADGREEKGWLTFDVCEQKEEDMLKLMAYYGKTFKAVRFQKTTTMFIQPEDGQVLIERYLKQ